MKRTLEKDGDSTEKKICSYENATDSELEKKLVELIRNKKKHSMKKANFFVTLDDLKSFEKSMEDKDKSEWRFPQFFVQDLQRVILFSLIGDQYRFFPRWCKIIRPKYMKKVHLLTIDNLSEYDYKTNEKEFKKIKQLFQNKNGQVDSIEFVSPFANGSTFLDEFINVPITKAQWMKIRDEEEFQQKRQKMAENYRKLFKQIKKIQKSNQHGTIESSELDKIARTSLLLNSSQMVREDYPMPFDQSGTHSFDDYVFTNENYMPVSNTSPMYSIDCEMCYNEDGDMEPMWLAMVNENLECVYETLIKPKKKIRNYLTHITGVTANMFEDVVVQLEDVQKKLMEILPADAILCGQSLNNDLHSLKMFHPYVIDTSIVYNLSGNREIKPSLRKLSAQFLGKLIQEASHNPAIDAKASIQLVLLKLRHGVDFGDVIVNGCVNIYEDFHNETNISHMTMDNTDLSDPDTISKYIYQTGLNINQEFFNILRDNEISNAYIDNKERCKTDLLGSRKNVVFYKDTEEAFDLAEVNKEKKFLWTHLYFENKNEKSDKTKLKELMKSVRNFYNNLPDDSLFMLAFTGRSDFVEMSKPMKLNQIDKNDFAKGRCFLKYKCLEMEELDAEVKHLYGLVNKNKIVE